MTGGVTSNQIALFLVVLARASGLVLSAPLIGDAQTPRLVKAALAIALSLVLVTGPSVARAVVPVDMLPFALVVVAQLLVGIALGFVARLIFLAMQSAGELVSMQMGLSNASIFNPMTRQPESVISQFYMIVTALTFLALNGDAWVTASLARSYDLAPLSATAFSPGVVTGAIKTAITVTELGLQIAMPIAASLFAANVVLGVVSRSLPQLNIFMLSMPLDLMLGLLALIGSMAALAVVLGHLVDGLPQTMLSLFQAVSGQPSAISH